MTLVIPRVIGFSANTSNTREAVLLVSIGFVINNPSFKAPDGHLLIGDLNEPYHLLHFCAEVFLEPTFIGVPSDGLFELLERHCLFIPKVLLKVQSKAQNALFKQLHDNYELAVLQIATSRRKYILVVKSGLLTSNVNLLVFLRNIAPMPLERISRLRFYSA